MTTSARELARSAVTLVSLPDVYLKAKAKLDDPDFSVASVGQIIGHDPALTARLLRVVNSAFFGFAARIDTVSRAVAVLGRDPVHDLLLATSVTQTFKDIPEDVLDMRTFWTRSIHCAVTARLLAAHCNVLDGERMFVEGLLADIGHLVLFLQVPGVAREALVQARHEGVETHLVERELIGFDYADVGAELLREWRLPENVCEAVGRHPEPGLAEQFPLEAAIVHIAYRIAAHDADADPGIDPFAWRTTGLEAGALAGIREDALTHTRDTIALLLPEPDVPSRRAARG